MTFISLSGLSVISVLVETFRRQGMLWWVVSVRAQK